MTESTTETFYEGDPFIFVIQYSVSGSSSFALQNVQLKDVLTGLDMLPNGVSVEGSSIDFPDGLSAPFEL